MPRQPFCTITFSRLLSFLMQALALCALAAATSVRGAAEQEALQAADAMLDAELEKGARKNAAAEAADKLQAAVEKSLKDVHGKYDAFVKKTQAKVDAATKRLEAAKAPFETEAAKFAKMVEDAKTHIHDVETQIAAEEAKLKQLATEKDASIAAANGDADLIKAAEDVYAVSAAAINTTLEGLKKQLADEKTHLADAEASIAKLHKDKDAVVAKGHAAAENLKHHLADAKKVWEDNIKRAENALAALKHH